jgi:protein LTV1
MPRKTRSFIDKKNATHYTMVRRSQRDPLFHDEKAVRYVMQPVGGGAEIDHDEFRTEAAGSHEHGTTASAELREVDEMGFKNDGYDYSQHFAVIGDGTFVGTDGQARTDRAHMLPKQKPSALPADIDIAPAELERHLEAITMDVAGMDPEILAALESDAESAGGEGFEELLDDFVVTAATADESSAAAEEAAAPAFDFDAHVKRLLAAAERDDMIREGKLYDGPRRAPRKVGVYEESDSGDEYFETDDDSDGLEIEDVTGGGGSGAGGARSARASGVAVFASAFADLPPATSVEALRLREQQRFVDERFELMISQYDDEELGALQNGAASDSDDGGAGGAAVAGGEARLTLGDGGALDAILDQYLEDNPKTLATGGSKGEQQRRKKAGVAPLPSLMGALSTTVKTAGCNELGEYTTALSDVIVQLAAARVAEAALAPEVVEEDVNKAIDDDVASYFGLQTRVKSKWDCESVLSTYSTTDNLPTLIGRRRKKKKKALVLIHPRTGLPMVEGEDEEEEEEEEGDEEEEEEEEAPVAGTARQRGETKEQRKQRKALVKEQRRKRREEKKAMKGAFKSEQKRQLKQNNHMKRQVQGKRVP